MATEIPTDFFLASLLYNRNKITRKEIKEYGRKIYSQFKGKRLYIKTTTNDLYAEMESSSNYFLKEDIIYKLKDSGIYFNQKFILNTLGHSLEKGLREKIFEILNS